MCQFYYWAANLRSILFWTKNNSTESIPAWLHIELSSVAPLSLPAFLCQPFTDPPLKCNKNTVVANSMRIWRQITTGSNILLF